MIRRNIDYCESKQLQLVMYTMNDQKTMSETDADAETWLRNDGSLARDVEKQNNRQKKGNVECARKQGVSGVISKIV